MHHEKGSKNGILKDGLIIIHSLFHNYHTGQYNESSKRGAAEFKAIDGNELKIIRGGFVDLVTF